LSFVCLIQIQKIKVFIIMKCVTPASFSTAYKYSASSMQLCKNTLLWGQSLHFAKLLVVASFSDLGERNEYLIMYELFVMDEIGGSF
jgi:hypothetical protein